MQMAFLASIIIYQGTGQLLFHQDLFLYAKINSAPILLVYVLASFSVNLTHTRVLLEEGTSTKKMPLPDWPVGKPVVGVLLDL